MRQNIHPCSAGNCLCFLLSLNTVFLRKKILTILGLYFTCGNANAHLPFVVLQKYVVFIF